MTDTTVDVKRKPKAARRAPAPQASSQPVEPSHPLAGISEIDLERVVYDPEYREIVRERLNRTAAAGKPRKPKS